MIERASKVAGDIIEAMKNEPLSLALVVMNLALLFMFYFILDTVAESRRREVAMVHQEQKEIRELLLRCAMCESRR